MGGRVQAGVLGEEIRGPKNGPAAAQLLIVGPQMLLNGLMATLIERSIGLPCRCIGLMDLRAAAACRGPLLVLIDGHPRGAGDRWPDLRALLSPRRLNLTVGLHNLPASDAATFAGEALRAGIRGLFYQDDPPEMLVEGIKALLAGRRWFSRPTPEGVRGARSHGARGGGEALGFRERQILRLIAAGLTNVEIARQLNLSVHTIKSHAYNLYRKINAPNRVQATLWAAKHMPH